MPQLRKYLYGNHQVYFDMKNEDVEVNASAMAKIFNKDVTQFLRNANTKSFIKSLELKLGNPSFRTIKGGKYASTWMHRKLALKFAAWLNPDFEVWVYDIIDKLLFGGYKVLQHSIYESAQRKNRMLELKHALKGNDHYEELVRLQLEERQSVYKRTAEIKNQMQIFS